MASALRNFKFENHTRINRLLVWLRSRNSLAELPRGIANFGFATLATELSGLDRAVHLHTNTPCTQQGASPFVRKEGEYRVEPCVRTPSEHHFARRQGAEFHARSHGRGGGGGHRRRPRQSGARDRGRWQGVGHFPPHREGRESSHHHPEGSRSAGSP